MFQRQDYVVKDYASEKHFFSKRQGKSAWQISEVLDDSERAATLHEEGWWVCSRMDQGNGTGWRRKNYSDIRQNLP